MRDCAETLDLVMLGICYMDTSDQVLMSNGSALPQAEGEDGIAKVIHRQVANCVPTPVLESFDCEFIELTFDSNEEDTEESVLLGSMQIGFPAEHNEEYEVTSVSFDAEFPKFTETSSTHLYEDLAPVDLASTMSTSYSSHDYKTNIEGFMSEEEEREICDIPSHPPSLSLVPYLLLMNNSLAELNVLNAQLAVRKMRTLVNPLDLKRTLNLSYKPYNRFCALSESQHFPVHLTCAS